jgi:hypothetical protein
MTPSEGMSFVQESDRGGAARPSEMRLKLDGPDKKEDAEDGYERAANEVGHEAANEVGRVDTVELPGVNGDEEHAPDSVEIQDLDNPSEMMLKLDGPDGSEVATKVGSEVATEDGSETANDGDAKSQTCQASSMKKLEMAFTKSIKKSFTQLQRMDESDSDISDSDESQGESHFQFDEDGFQFTQVEHKFEPQIAKLFKRAWTTRKVRNNSKLSQAAGTQTKPDLREFILLDSQSTMDLFCNCALVKRTFRSNKSMHLKRNGGTMVVITKKAEVVGYHTDVWYDKNAITNILALSNIIKQYRITYDSDEQMFVVHWESANKPNKTWSF